MEAYIYQFFDAQECLLYVGSTSNIDRRIHTQHFGKNGHLPYECYMRTEKILYMTCSSISDATIREKYLINKYAPVFNDKMNNEHQISFIIDYWNWRLFSLKRDEEPWLSVFDGCNKGYSYRVYEDLFSSPKKIKTFDVIPCVSTCLWNETISIDAVSVNQQIWLFFERVLDTFGHVSKSLTINGMVEYIDDGLIDAEDICVTTDKHLIDLNIWFDGEHELPDHTVLVTLSGTISFLEKMDWDECSHRYSSGSLLKCLQFYDQL